MNVSIWRNIRLILCLLAVLLTSCGGGGGSDSDPSSPSNDAADTGGESNAGVSDFAAFEAGQVRPLAFSPDGSHLYAINTPANQLEIFSVDDSGMLHQASVAVGLEPVAVAARDGEVWVVNYLSDSVSIVDVSGATPYVKRTLWVGDEPSDIVFAGSGNNRAFITTARRGQNHQLAPKLTTAGLGRASIWVFDTQSLGSTAGGTPLKIVTLFGNSPRALARSADGSKVYTAIFHSGNQTTSLTADNLAKDGPNTDTGGIPAPDTGLIVRYNGSRWLDGDGNDWTDRVRFTLPDYDVFAIDANASSPNVTQQWSGVGTTLFNIAVNPQSGALYVSNLEARNQIRFEGSGDRGSSVRGHFVENRITVLDGSSVLPRHLNKHINYASSLGSVEENAASLALPLGMAVSADGATLYMAAFGSQKIGVFSTSALANNSFTPSAGNQIELPGGGPSGVVLDETRHRLYTLTRFDNAVVAINLDDKSVAARIALSNPEPTEIINGRRFLYDARLSSSRGDSACGSCHIFGDMDFLAWDLGNPDGAQTANPNPYVDNPVAQGGKNPVFHPLKGPMMTQSLRGMAGNGPLHWRGDKTGSNKSASETLEQAAFKEFNGAFVSLLGRESELSATQMTSFAKFAMRLSYPPNPIRNLDNSLTDNQAAGRNIYLNAQTTGIILQCNTCHTLDATQGYFGTSGKTSIEGPDISQNMKVPQLRNAYTKVGMFGRSPRGSRDMTSTGNQIAGFGFANDGSVDTINSFLSASVFIFPNETSKNQVVDFVLAFDSDMAPIMGQQVTLDRNSPAAALDRLDLMIARAAITTPRAECDLIAHGLVAGEYRSALLNSSAEFVTDRNTDPHLSISQIKGLAQQAGNVLTFTCAPPGSGDRIAFGIN